MLPRREPAVEVARWSAAGQAKLGVLWSPNQAAEVPSGGP